MYDCKKKTASGDATMFWESDRSKSTFSMKCKPDGTFDFVNERENWPTYLADIQCTDLPPAIPTSEEYVLQKDDGTVTAQYYVYPLPVTFNTKTYTSEVNNSLIPRNYNAKLV